MRVKSYIEFEFDTNDLDLDIKNYDELKNYATSCMVEDIEQMVKYNELYDAIRVEAIDDL